MVLGFFVVFYYLLLLLTSYLAANSVSLTCRAVLDPLLAGGCFLLAIFSWLVLRLFPIVTPTFLHLPNEMC